MSGSRVAVWVLPGPDDEPVEYRTPYAEAVAEQRATALARGYVYASDDDAFGDFVSTTWAVVLVVCGDDSPATGWPFGPRCRVLATGPMGSLATCRPASSRKAHPTRCARGAGG